MTIIITGGAGFIGSTFINNWLMHLSEDIVNIDKLTYAGNMENLININTHHNYHFYRNDICDESILKIFRNHTPRALIHFAAESHVDQ